MREPIPRVDDREPEPTDPALWWKWKSARSRADVERIVSERKWPRTRAIETPREDVDRADAGSAFA